MFAAYEEKIISRLQARVADVTVATLEDITRVPELRQKAPAVFVMYDGYTVAEDIANGRIASLSHEWLVVCAAKSAVGRGDAIVARNAVAEIASSVLSALLGFDVGGGAFLHLQPAPGIEFDGGYCYLPLLFVVRGTVKGSID